jgi:oligopeptide transport system permease protein
MKPESLFSKLIQKKSALISIIFLALLFVFVFIGPYFLQDPLKQNLKLGLSAPSAMHWLGTDELGRDLFSRLAKGGQLSLMIATLATLVSLIIGTTYGMVTGYFGGKIDQVGMRIVDILYSLPYMFLVILLISIFGKNVFILFIALGAVQWLTTARIVRGQVLSLKNQEFIQACKVLGIPTWRILLKHILPNITGVIVVYASLTIPAVILQEAFLSFLGLNVSDCTWGLLAAEGASVIDIGWWLILFPGLILSLSLLAFNLIGDALRDCLDNKLN